MIRVNSLKELLHADKFSRYTKARLIIYLPYNEKEANQNMRITFKQIYQDIDNLVCLSNNRNSLNFREIELTRKRLVENIKAIELHTIILKKKDPG